MAGTPPASACRVRCVLVLLTRFGIGLKGSKGKQMGALAAADQAKLAPPSLQTISFPFFAVALLLWQV